MEGVSQEFSTQMAVNLFVCDRCRHAWARRSFVRMEELAVGQQQNFKHPYFFRILSLIKRSRHKDF